MFRPTSTVFSLILVFVACSDDAGRGTISDGATLDSSTGATDLAPSPEPDVPDASGLEPNDPGHTPDLGDEIDPVADTVDAVDTTSTDVPETADSSPFILDCDAYCALIDATCTGEAAVYDGSAQCHSACEALPLGVVPDGVGPTLACRFGYALLAADDPGSAGVRCHLAGPTGAGKCGTECEAYCALMEGLCPGSYSDADACSSACAQFPTDAPEGTATGNSYACRVEAALDGACQSAVSHGGAVCVVPTPPGDTCEAAKVVLGLPFKAQGDTTSLADDYAFDGGPCGGEFGGSGGQGAPDEVWRVEALGPGTLTISVVGKGGFDSILYVLSDCVDPTASCVDKKDSVGFQATETIELSVTGGTAWYLVVDASGTGGTYYGTYELAVSFSPAQ